MSEKTKQILIIGVVFIIAILLAKYQGIIQIGVGNNIGKDNQSDIPINMNDGDVVYGDKIETHIEKDKT